MSYKDWPGTDVARFRASVDMDADWDLRRPSPDLAWASKISPGGRLLLAFDLEEVRDFFVDGHQGNNAQAEPDGANRASRRKPSAKPPEPPASLEEAFDAYRASNATLEETEQNLEDIFNVEILRLAGEGKREEAIAIVHSMPGACFAKTMAISGLHNLDPEAGPWPRGEPAALTKEQAASLVVWQRAWLAHEATTKAMETLLTPMVEGFVEKGDKAGLSALFERTPNSMAKVFMADALRSRMPKAVVKAAAAPHP